MGYIYISTNYNVNANQYLFYIIDTNSFLKESIEKI